MILKIFVSILALFFLQCSSQQVKSLSSKFNLPSDSCDLATIAKLNKETVEFFSSGSKAGEFKYYIFKDSDVDDIEAVLLSCSDIEFYGKFNGELAFYQLKNEGFYVENRDSPVERNLEIYWDKKNNRIRIDADYINNTLTNR